MWVEIGVILILNFCYLSVKEFLRFFILKEVVLNEEFFLLLLFKLYN